MQSAGHTAGGLLSHPPPSHHITTLPKPSPRYAHPLDLVPLVDLNLGKVINIECYDKPAT
jgi:hypothetical protein